MEKDNKPDLTASLAGREKFRRDMIEYLASQYNMRIDKEDPLLALVFMFDALQNRFYSSEKEALDKYYASVQTMTEDFAFDARAISKASVQEVKGLAESFQKAILDSAGQFCKEMDDALRKHSELMKSNTVQVQKDKKTAFYTLLASCGVLALSVGALIIILMKFAM